MPVLWETLRWIRVNGYNRSHASKGLSGKGPLHYSSTMLTTKTSIQLTVNVLLTHLDPFQQGPPSCPSCEDLGSRGHWGWTVDCLSQTSLHTGRTCPDALLPRHWTSGRAQPRELRLSLRTQKHGLSPFMYVLLVSPKLIMHNLAIVLVFFIRLLLLFLLSSWDGFPNGDHRAIFSHNLLDDFSGWLRCCLLLFFLLCALCLRSILPSPPSFPPLWFISLERQKTCLKSFPTTYYLSRDFYIVDRHIGRHFWIRLYHLILQLAHCCGLISNRPTHASKCFFLKHHL